MTQSSHSPATTDDTTYVRISKRELLQYIALQTQLNALALENSHLRTLLQSHDLVAPLPLQSNPPIVTQSPSFAGPVRSRPSDPESIKISTLSTQNEFTISPDEPLALINSALAAFPPPPVTAEAYDENGRIVQKQIASSSVDYASIIETVTELVKLKDKHTRLVNTNLDQPTPMLYLPYLMTPENTRVIMNAVELGVTRYRACALVGVSRSTYNDWRTKASTDLEPYASFLALFELAEARTEAALVHAWRQHVRDGWQAADGFLKKRFRNEWGEKQAISLTRAEIANLPTNQLEDALGPEAINAITGDDDPSIIDDPTNDTTDALPTDVTDYEIRDEL